MHELSIALGVLDVVEEEAHARPAAARRKLQRSISNSARLSGVVKEAFFRHTTSPAKEPPWLHANCESRKSRSSLIAPATCQSERAPWNRCRCLCCAKCGTPTPTEILTGRELEIAATGDLPMPPARPTQTRPSQTRLVEVRQNVLKQNDLVARELRQRFHDAGIFVVSLVSSPGSGKTAFLERILTAHAPPPPRGPALVGDLATDNDARRLYPRDEAPVKQIVTGTVCHLEAEMVRTALDGWMPDNRLKS